MEWLLRKHSLSVSWEGLVEETQLDYGYEEISDFVKMLIFKIEFWKFGASEGASKHFD